MNYTIIADSEKEGVDYLMLEGLNLDQMLIRSRQLDRLSIDHTIIFMVDGKEIDRKEYTY